MRHHYDMNKYELYFTATSFPLGDTTMISSMYTSHCIHIKTQRKLFAFLTSDAVLRTTPHCFLVAAPSNTDRAGSCVRLPHRQASKDSWYVNGKAILISWYVSVPQQKLAANTRVTQCSEKSKELIKELSQLTAV